MLDVGMSLYIGEQREVHINGARSSNGSVVQEEGPGTSCQAPFHLPWRIKNMRSSFSATIVEHIKPIEGSLPITRSSPLFSLSEVLVAVCSLLLG